MNGVGADRLVDEGLEAHRRGDLAAAAAAYRRALDKAPRHADALHLLGLAEHQSGRHAAAAELIGRAVAINRDFAPYHANLALAQQEMGALDAAERSLRRALKLDAGYVEARHNLAMLRKRQGKPDEAEAGFRALLRDDPDYLEAHRQLGLLLLEQGRPADALDHLVRVVGLAPRDAGALNNVAVALRALGRIGEALAYQQAAANQAPRDSATLGNLAGTYFAAGALTQAADLYAQALALDGRNAGLLNNFAMTLQAMGRLDDAEACFDAAAAADPANPGPLDNLGSLLMLRGRPEPAAARHRAALALDPLHAHAWNNLGNALAAGGRQTAAFKSWRCALAIRPALAEAWTNLGVGLAGGEHFPAAAAALRRALRLDAYCAAAWNNLGDALRLEDGQDRTVRRYARAAALEPGYAEAWSNLGLAEQRGGDLDRGERLFDRAIRLKPDLAGARFNRGLLRLEAGRLADGWPDYAYRFASGKVGKARTPLMPPWRGEALKPGEKLLVWREQGLGDEILFASMYGELLARGIDAVFECDPRLVGLLARALPPGAVVRPQNIDAAGNETLNPPDCARHAPAGSLARLLRGRLTDFAGGPSWLAADPARAADFRNRLDRAAPGVLRVGIAWRSQFMTAERRAAYLRLDDFAPLFALPGVAWVNVQYGEVEAEIADAEARLGVRLLRWPDLDLKDDLEGAAALTAALDLVIAPAVSAAELSAALGAPTWRLGGRDWTWAGTAARPWTPAVRVFAPRPGESLADATARLAAALGRLAAGGAGGQAGRSADAAPDPRRLVNAGSAALARDDRAAAASAAAAALALAPAMAEALTLAGAARRAPVWQRRALAVVPGHPTALVNLGRALAADSDWGQALATLRRACAAAPDRAAAYANLCHVLRFRGAAAAARRAADRALTLDAGLRAARANRALLRLAAGDLPGGWDDYGARLRAETPLPPLEALAGRAVEATAEQGLGDEVLFATCLPDLLRLAGRVRLVCDRRLVGLFARSFPTLEVRPHGTPAPGPAEIALPAGDLPRLFRRRLADFPAGSAPLLVADPARTDRWRRVLAAAGAGLKVGVAWSSGLDAAERRACRTSLADWAPLAALAGVALVNMQYGAVEAEIAAAEQGWGRPVLRWPGLNLWDDMEETAALCAALDVVVAIPTAACELAAAVGTPTLRLTPPGDWTTMGTAARPWFPNQKVVSPPPGGGLAQAVGAAALYLRSITRAP